MNLSCRKFLSHTLILFVHMDHLDTIMCVAISSLYCGQSDMRMHISLRLKAAADAVIF